MLEILEGFLHIFPGIESFLLMGTKAAIVRVILIGVGFLIVYLGYKRILDPLLMIPMGIGICMVNAAIFMMPPLEPGQESELGTMFLNPFVSTPTEHINALQVYFFAAHICLHLLEWFDRVSGFYRNWIHNRS